MFGAIGHHAGDMRAKLLQLAGGFQGLIGSDPASND